jgi:RHS repeat-associated protein
MRFNGQLIDTATGLYDLRTRMYDPALGRFLQFDPLAPTRLEPYAGSYVYVIDRPTVFTDPSGLCFIGLFGDDCDNPIHTAVQKVTEVGKVIYKGVKGCIKGLPYGVLGGGAVGGAIGGFSGPEGVGPGAAAGAVVGGTASCAAGAAYEIYKPPLSPDIPPLAYESAAGLLYASPVGYSEK